MPVWVLIFEEKNKVIKVIPIGEALASSETEGCWVLV
jgi:hypothetical protein